MIIKKETLFPFEIIKFVSCEAPPVVARTENYLKAQNFPNQCFQKNCFPVQLFQGCQTFENLIFKYDY